MPAIFFILDNLKEIAGMARSYINLPWSLRLSTGCN